MIQKSKDLVQSIVFNEYSKFRGLTRKSWFQYIVWSSYLKLCTISQISEYNVCSHTIYMAYPMERSKNVKSYY